MSVDTDVSADTDAPVVQHARATVRPEKAATVAELTEAFRASSAAVLTEYRGLTVKQIGALRTALGADTSYAVVKNTLTRIAANDAGLEGVDALLAGPTAVAFINGEPVEAAKALRDFARTNPALVVKGGVMDGRALSADEVRRLADLESREVLLAKMAGALLASLSGAVRLFNEPLAQAARLAGALQDKAAQDPSVIGGAGTAAGDLVEAALVAEDTVAEDTVAEDTVAEDTVAEVGVTAPDTAAAAEETSTSTESTGTDSSSTDSTGTAPTA